MDVNAMIEIKPAKLSDVYPWLIERHYAKRLCPISYAFAAYDKNRVVGVVTYGTPVSSSLRVGVCGCEYCDHVIELNRLVCNNVKNLASQLVGKSLKMLPKPKIVISYADTKQGHIGYIYQATNFIYTGLSAKRTDWKVRGKEHLHGATIADESRGKKNRSQYMRDKYGDDFYLEDRPRKHRYIYFCGTRKQKSAMKKSLNYGIKPYPKGQSKTYDASGYVHSQGVLF